MNHDQAQEENEQPLHILYRDEFLIAIHKPAGMMTHRSRIAEDDEVSAMERLRDQIDTWVYPIHRLDRATSGVLLFALDRDTARILHENFAEGLVKKTYWAVTRGHAPAYSFVDRELKEKRDRVTDRKAKIDKPAQEARTHIESLAHLTLPIALGRYPTARFSLVQARPETGRRHQIRRHLAGLNYPIIGDTTHGRGEQNRFFRSHFQVHRLLLAATELTLQHPYRSHTLSIKAPLTGSMKRFCSRYFFEKSHNFTTPLVPAREGFNTQIDWLISVDSLTDLVLTKNNFF